MKKLFYIVILFSFLTHCIAAECDWKTIEEKDGKFIYSKECNIKVGQLVKEMALKDEQIVKLNKVIELKDLMILKGDERIELWRATTYKLEDRLISQDKWSNRKDWLYFAGGIIVTIAVGVANSYARK